MNTRRLTLAAKIRHGIVLAGRPLTASEIRAWYVSHGWSRSAFLAEIDRMYRAGELVDCGLQWPSPRDGVATGPSRLYGLGDCGLTGGLNPRPADNGDRMPTP